MPDHMPIGHDIDLLCDAVEVVTRLQRADARVIQRRVRVGFAKAGRLLLLLSDYGITGAPDSRGRYPVLVACDERAAAISRLREMAGKEPCQCHGSFAAVSPTHPGHCCFLPADQDCHPEAIAEWERLRDLRRPPAEGKPW
jgi:hypothetical protein